MLCDACDGTGTVARWRTISAGGVMGRQRALRREPCPVCSGTRMASFGDGAEQDAVTAALAMRAEDAGPER